MLAKHAKALGVRQIANKVVKIARTIARLEPIAKPLANAVGVKRVVRIVRTPARLVLPVRIRARLRRVRTLVRRLGVKVIVRIVKLVVKLVLVK